MSARILVVDDNEVNVELLAAMLASEHYVVSTATDGFEALAKIEAEKPDIVLLDVMMPELDGFEVCRRIKADPTMADIPVIMVTALSDVDDLVRGFEAGADDFVTKPFDVLALMARVHLQLRRKRHYAHILEQSRVDRLTGAFNLHYLEVYAPRLAARCRAARRPVAVLMIDVDHLKQINEAHGHAGGNHALRGVANRATSALRPSDLVARMGGDEFVVVMPETDLDAAFQIAERLRGRINDAPIQGVAVTVSIGAAASRPDGEEELDATLQRADAALYEAKGGGGNRVIADGGGETPHTPLENFSSAVLSTSSRRSA
jgi:two-component system cell cycle response regulator